MGHSFKVNILSEQIPESDIYLILVLMLMIKMWLTYFFLVQMKFTDAMRSKARLSITGSTSENGRVPVAYLRPGLPMSLSMTDLSWPRPSQCLKASGWTSSLPLWKWMEMLVISFSDQLFLTMGDPPWIFSLEFSQSYLSEDSWSHSLTSSLEILDRCCPSTTWLSGFSKDLPTYKGNHLTISEKNDWLICKFMKNNQAQWTVF